MYNQALLLAAAAGVQVAYADYMIITGSAPSLPTPSFANPEESSKYVESVASKAEDLFISYVGANPEVFSLIAASPSIDAQIEAFAATATGVSIPAEATDDSTTVTYTTVPAWFTQLPKEVQDYQNKINSHDLALESLLVAQITSGSTTLQTSVNTTATPTNGTSTIVETKTDNGTLKTDPAPPPPSKTDEGQPKPSSGANAQAVGVSSALLALAVMGVALL